MPSTLNAKLAASASDDNVDEYYQNIALNNFNNDINNNINLTLYLNDNIEQTVLFSQNDVSTCISNEYQQVKNNDVRLT